MIKLKIIQFKPEHKNLDFNFNIIKNHILKVNQNNDVNSNVDGNKINLIIFPELALSGYFFEDKNELRKYAISTNSDYLSELQEIATTNKIVVIFGFAELDGKYIYNSSISISPNPNETKVYRKSHLFYKENLVFDKFFPSDIKSLNYDKTNNFKPQYISHLDLNIGNIICYDWRFPEITQQYALNGCELIICPANLVTKVWKNSLPARALDNRVFFALSNRIGKEQIAVEELYFTGCSSFYDTNGNLVSQLSETEEGEIEVLFDHLLARDKSINKYNNIFVDRRIDLY